MDEEERSTGKGKKIDLDGGDPRKKANTTGPQTPARTSTSGGGVPTTSTPGTKSPVKAPPVTAPPPPPPREQTKFQKGQLKSEFQSIEGKARLDYAIGNTHAPLYDDDDDEPTALGAAYDGITPDPSLTRRDLWKAVQAPVQSREGRRSRALLQMVINQFAVGHNPRYEPDEPTKPRAHIFVWDVSRAMNCEIPHFVGAKELTLSQTVDWLRHEGPMRGWTRAGIEDAQAATMEGKLVVAVPKEIKLRMIAVVLPEKDFGPDRKPWVAAAALVRGNKVKLSEALGAFVVDFFVHA